MSMTSLLNYTARVAVLMWTEYGVGFAEHGSWQDRALTTIETEFLRGTDENETAAKVVRILSVPARPSFCAEDGSSVVACFDFEPEV